MTYGRKVGQVFDLPCGITGAKGQVKDLPYFRARSFPLSLPGPAIGLFSLLLSVAPHAHAHDPFEITTDARLGATTLELRVTMARSTALAVARGVEEAPTFEPGKFAVFQPEFERAAPRLYTITAGNGAALAPVKATVALGVEADVEFRLSYARPARGFLRFEAKPLALLGAGYGDVFELRDSTGAVLARTLLGADQPEVSVNLPELVGSGPPLRRRGVSALAAVTIVVGLCWLLRRRLV